MAKMVKLVSSDGVEFAGIDVYIAAKSQLIKQMLQNVFGEAEKTETVISLEHVKGETLAVVMDWFNLDHVS